MWNEAAMHRNPEDGRNQGSAWGVPAIIFIGLIAASLFVGGAMESAHAPAHPPAGGAKIHVAR